MLGYIPRAVQLKLFRYALSKLDILDHSTYDVERDFNLSLGLSNELEMKNLGLNVSKLSSTLKLPPEVQIHDAKVLSLRIRIPTDFHKTPVKVTISSVIVDGEILNDDTTTYPTYAGDNPERSSPVAEEGFKIPSGIDLTSSFLQDCPLEADEVDVVLQSKLETSSSSLDDDSEEDEGGALHDTGLGTPLNFWNFVPSFFQRLVDRVEIDIQNIAVRVKVPCPNDLPGSIVDSLTVIFNIESIGIEGVFPINQIGKPDQSCPRTVKPGMRAVRLNGITLSLLGHPGFFQNISSFSPESACDADTVTSGSTILPQSGVFVRNEADNQANNPISQTMPSFSSEVSGMDLGSVQTTRSTDHHFYAQMQEPEQSCLHLSPSPPVGDPRDSASPSSVLQASCSSGELGSRILPISFLHPESDQSSLQFNPGLQLPDSEQCSRDPKEARITALLPQDNFRDSLRDDSDNDSLQNEPRNFDLFQEPNTKFFGVTNVARPSQQREGCDLDSHTTSQPYLSDITTNSCPNIAEPVPIPAPLISISQTLSNLENVDDSRASYDEYTYYEDPVDYSNPDLLYLSRSTDSIASSCCVDDVLQQGTLPGAGNERSESLLQQTEPHVVYTRNEGGEESDTESIYESYPASEADDAPGFITKAPIISQKVSNSYLAASDQTEIPPPLSTGGLPARTDILPGHADPGHISTRFTDADIQKVSRDAAIRMQSQTAPLSLSTSSESANIQVAETEIQTPTSDESCSEGSESALAESMIFTHEEAGSLYLSALGSSQPYNPPLPSLAEENRRIGTTLPINDQPVAPIRKQLLQIDFIDIFVPGIALLPNAASINQELGDLSHSEIMSESTYPNMPGAFSVYAASRSDRKKTSDTARSLSPTRSKPKPTVSFQTHKPELPQANSHKIYQKSSTSMPSNRVKLDIGHVKVSLDPALGRRLAIIVASLRLYKEVESTSSAPNMMDPTGTGGIDFTISLQYLTITLVSKMLSDNIGLQQSPEAVHINPMCTKFTPLEDTESLDLITIILTKGEFRHCYGANNDLGMPIVTSEVSLKSCIVKAGNHEVIKLLKDEKVNHLGKGKITAPDSVFLMRIDDTRKSRHVDVRLEVVNFYFPTRELESMLIQFGGLENMLNSIPVTQKTEYNTPKSSHVRGAESKKHSGLGKQTSLNADLAGIIVEIFVSDAIGGVGLSTSSIKIVSNSSSNLTVKIPQLAIVGSGVAHHGASESASTYIVFNTINLAFDSSPTEEDLERLLTMIMPSADRYDGDDNVMVDVLLRQRRRGSVLRIDTGKSSGRLNDMNDISRFTKVAEELAKMATVAKYIPQDERPGMLTLVSVDDISFTLFAGLELQNFSSRLKEIEICHVAAPALLALGVGQVFLRRNSEKVDEEWIGESVPHHLAIANDKQSTRPMLKVRMIGDEPEPEVKIKIWNTRVEYYVEPVLALLSLTPKDTSDVVVANMVSSIAILTEKEFPKESKIYVHQKNERSPPLRLKISLSGFSVALNPLNSNARAIFIIHDGCFISAFPDEEPFSASLELYKANLVAIDNRHNLLSAQRHPIDTKKQKQQTEELLHYSSQGYVPLLTTTNGKANIKLDGDEDRTMFVNVDDVFIFIESCADSTQTVIEILNGMKPPLPESEEIKYMTQIMPVDVFANMDENAFVPMENAFIGGQPRNLKSLEDMPEDLLEDEISFNSQLIESYYPSSDMPSSDSPSTSSVPPPPRPVPKSFHDQVCVVAEEPLAFDDNYIQDPSEKSPETEAKTPSSRKAALKVNIRNTQLIWNLHDGYDWIKTRDTISKAVKKVEERASRRRRRHSDMPRTLNEIEETDDDDGDEESATYDVLFNSIYITLPLHKDPRDLSKDIQNQIKGNFDLQSETGSHAHTVTTSDSFQSPGVRFASGNRRDQKYQRSQRNAMQFELKGVDADFTIFEPDKLEIQSTLDVRINEVQVTENVRTSTWRMFLTYMREAGVRERGLPMAHIHVDTLRPIPELAATELSIKVKLLPLRLYVDQDALEFLTRFFEFKDPDNLKPGVKQEEPFIQRCEIDTVRVKLDFKPKRVDYAGLRSGRTTEFMNFFILEEADMELRHVALNGVSGFERLGKDLNNIWMPDIKQNQLGGVVAGVAPLRSLVNLGTGVRDLVKVPIMEYRKDGRLVRSIKKGTQNFVKTSGSEVARLGAKLAIGTQTFLERTEEFLVGEQLQPKNYLPHEAGPSESDNEGATAAFSPYADQPLGVYNGLIQARRGLTRNFNEAKDAIMRVPSEAAQGGSAKSAAAAVFRAAPTAVIRPMIGVTEAVHKTLHGIDNTIDREKREKLRDKYKKRTS